MPQQPLPVRERHVLLHLEIGLNRQPVCSAISCRAAETAQGMPLLPPIRNTQTELHGVAFTLETHSARARHHLPLAHGHVTLPGDKLRRTGR